MEQNAHTQNNEKFKCATHARSEYGLTDRDLEALECQLVRNPHYRTAAPMRLYRVTELQALAARKAAQPVLTIEDKKKLKKDNIAAATQLAKLRLSAFQAQKIAEQQRHAEAGSALSIPIDVWTVVLKSIADTSKGDAIYSTSVAVRDICTAAGACRDFRLAARAALQLVAADRELVDPVSEDYNFAIKSPEELRLPALKRIARELSCVVTCPKPILIIKIFDALDLRGPCAEWVPASLVWLMRKERVTPWRQDEQLVDTMARAQRISGWRYFTDVFNVRDCRKRLRSMFPDQCALNEAFATALHATNAPKTQCRCGNPISNKCITRACGRCCRGPCTFHRA